MYNPSAIAISFPVFCFIVPLLEILYNHGEKEKNPAKIASHYDWTVFFAPLSERDSFRTIEERKEGGIGMKWIPSLISQDLQKDGEEYQGKQVYEDLKRELIERIGGEEKELFLRFLQVAENNNLQFGRWKYREGAQDTAREILEDLESCLCISHESIGDYPKRFP